LQAVVLTAFFTIQLETSGLVFSGEKHSYQESEIGESLDRSVFAPSSSRAFFKLKDFLVDKEIIPKDIILLDEKTIPF